jgi:gliding motility-associated-like protein
MKKLLLRVLLLSNFFGFGQYTLIPDVNFEKALISEGIDSGAPDGRVLTSSVIGITSFGISDTDLTDLTGIQDFVSLTELQCPRNKLTSLDISKNTSLTLLSCWGNDLTTLDTSKNAGLKFLSCFQNRLKSLDISKNPLMSQLYCSWNELTSLNLKNGNNNNLIALNVWSNANLTCIQVDNKTYSDNSWLASSKDATALYSEDCSKTAAAIAPPVITATGDQTYCPGSSINIVQSVSIAFDSTDPELYSVYIQISSGYINGQDQLTLNNASSHPSITAIPFDPNTGILQLTSANGNKVSSADFEAAIEDVQFRNSSPSPSGNRTFSISVATRLLSYLPRNKHFYEYVPSLGINWTRARDEASNKYYYGMQGYLATLTAADEAQLAGAQAPGAGWIGGSDAATEGTWKWVTGPEGLANGGTGTTFWIGIGNGSTTPPFIYANWNAPNEPNDSNNNEDYAHITSPAVGRLGTWNDLREAGDPITNPNYYPRGYIVEYGGMVPGDVDNIKISASTTISIAKITTTAPNSICASSTTTLQASTTTGTINWYNDAAYAVILGTGNSFTTPPLFTTTTYYIDNGCFPRTPITVTVEPLPIANSVIIPRQCDDNQDGKFTFNTATLESTLLNGQTNVTVTYFDQNNNPLKDANGNLITSPFPASFTTTSQTITAVVTNNTTLKCFVQKSISFIVDDLPEAFPIPTSLTTTCDDEANPLNQDGKFAFDTAAFETTILGGQTGMTVTYTLQNGTVLSTLAPTFLTGTQNVLVTVTNPLNATCNATTTLNFVVNAVPIVKDITIIQCDSDPIPDGKTLFNLTVNNTEISGNSANETFTYYTSLNGATNAIATDLIPNELAFENTTPTQMDIWSRITDPTTGCFSVAKITLEIPATTISPTYKIPFSPVCDDFLDANGNNNANNNNRDGITTFDFSATKGIILAQLPTNQVYSVNYYKNEADALAELNAINDISNYRNSDYPNTQDIWIRIDSDLDNACFGLGPYLTLNVEALPVANALTIPRECDDDSDGIFTFNTATLESDVLKGQTNSTVTYFDQANNPLQDANGILISSPFPATFASTSQTIKAVVTNSSPQACFDETTITFIVDDSPEAFAVDPNLTTICDNELDPIDQDGKFAFDTATFETTILGGQTGMIVEYYDQDNVLLPSPLPNPFVTNTQTITAKVLNPLNTICIASTIVNFIVNPVPNIRLNLDGSDDELVCSNLSSFFVTLDAGITDGSSTTNYDYVWEKDGQIVGTNSPTLDVNTVGIYTVEVTNNSGCSRIRTLTVTASNSATIVSVDVVDLTDNNTVTVNVTGPGDYEYSIDEPNGFWQDSNFFDNVPAGIHIVYVNDKNGCGAVNQEIIIVGVPKFFTPNGDGYNDYWSVKGVNETYNSKSIMYIFDRYGKLLKQWVPAATQGWDGSFNGVALPADDYWFTLKLEDGREAKGHFSLKR